MDLGGGRWGWEKLRLYWTCGQIPECRGSTDFGFLSKSGVYGHMIDTYQLERHVYAHPTQPYHIYLFFLIVVFVFIYAHIESRKDHQRPRVRKQKGRGTRTHTSSLRNVFSPNPRPNKILLLPHHLARLLPPPPGIGE